MAELLGLDGNRYKSTIPKEKIFTLVMEDDTMRENNIFRDFKIAILVHNGPNFVGYTKKTKMNS